MKITGVKIIAQRGDRIDFINLIDEVFRGEASLEWKGVTEDFTSDADRRIQEHRTYIAFLSTFLSGRIVSVEQCWDNLGKLAYATMYRLLGRSMYTNLGGGDMKLQIFDPNRHIDLAHSAAIRR